MDAARLERLLLDLRRDHAGLEWAIEPDQDSVGATAYLSGAARKNPDVVVELYPGVPSVRAHVERSSVFEEVPDADLPEFLQAVLSGRMRRLPPDGLMPRLLRVKTLSVDGRDKAWIATH